MTRTPKHPKRRGVLPPAGNFPRVSEYRFAGQTLRALQGEGGAENEWHAAIRVIKDALGVKGAALFPSGTIALSELAREFRERFGCNRAILAANTCPDVAVALVNAGYRLHVSDIFENTLDMELVPVDQEKSLVVLSNLYGLPDRSDYWLDDTRLMIDDACQAALSERDGVPVGCRGHAGIISFGRGKALGAHGGGAAIASTFDDIHHPVLDAKMLRGIFKDLNTLGSLASSPVRSLTDLLKVIAFPILEKPFLYEYLTRLPGTGLGETRCELDIFEKDLSRVQIRSGIAQLLSAAQTTRNFLVNARRWHERLGDFELLEPFCERQFAFDGKVIPTRYPLVFQSVEDCEAIYKAFSEAGLGVSRSYGKTLLDFPELDDYILPESKAECGREVAKRLLTLPVHRFVTEEDIERGRDIMLGVFGGHKRHI